MKLFKCLAVLIVLGCSSCSQAPTEQNLDNENFSNVDPKKEVSIQKQLAVVQKFIDEGSASACGSALSIVKASSATAEIQFLLGKGGISSESKKKIEDFEAFCLDSSR
tara:strand:- start:972 stop:1295 length:324 start_codon:yes stop_codon:yes gene_type:complete